jgi:hypothetical protein
LGGGKGLRRFHATGSATGIQAAHARKLMTTSSPLHDPPDPSEFIREIYLSEL